MTMTRRAEWPDYYILVGRTPIAVDSLTWGKNFSIKKRRVAYDDITDDCNVSTVFLGLDHNFWGEGDPILFETMIFGGPLNDYQRRYCTYAEAERGHAEAVVEARKACAQVKAIAEAAGANK
jgi:hypothetical protein